MIHITKSTILSEQFGGIPTLTVLYRQRRYVGPECFRRLRRKPPPTNQSVSTLLSPRPRVVTCLLPSLWSYLFWTFHLNGIVSCVVLGAWLLHLASCFRGLPVLQHMSTSFLFEAELYIYSTFCLSIHPLVDTWAISTFWLL